MRKKVLTGLLVLVLTGEGVIKTIEVIGGIIAISITILFIVLFITRPDPPIEIIGIFGIILGYYFGKNVSTK